LSAHNTEAVSEAKSAGYDPDVTSIFVDVDASESFRQWKAEESMTLTRTRSKAGGWYVTTHKRRTSTEEMLMLQGMRPDIINVQKLGRVSLNSAIGNAMSANVLERLFSRLLWVSGVVNNKIKDQWENPTFVSNGGHFCK
jgi:site-specific DNA-cytosine methylase